jgi:hypothetical protein
LANAKVSDGSQLPRTAASPLGVPAGARSLDRHGWASLASLLMCHRISVQPCGQYWPG